jgi:hypothetical protein
VGEARRGHRREDAAAGLEDLEIAGATLAELPLGLARAGEQQVRVRVDQARRDRAAAGVEPSEPAERVAAVLERGLERGPRADRSDPPLQQATTGASGDDTPPASIADSRPTSAWSGPIRRPPATVTTSDAPTTSRPGVGSSLRRRR